MPKLNLHKTRDLIQSCDFNSLFINELGWNNPSSSSINHYQAKPIAELGGISVFEITAENFPNSQQRAEIHKQISTINLDKSVNKLRKTSEVLFSSEV